MKKVALFYSFKSQKTSKIAGLIQESFVDTELHPFDVEEVNIDNFKQFDNLIIGVPTWFDGELPNYWDELLPELEALDYTGKKFAIFGLGDQKGYPENFCDAIGIMASFFAGKGAEIVGKISPEGYTFESSKALNDNEFMGLPLDQENQARLTKERINHWVELLKNQFN